MKFFTLIPVVVVISVTLMMIVTFMADDAAGTDNHHRYKKGGTSGVVGEQGIRYIFCCARIVEPELSVLYIHILTIHIFSFYYHHNIRSVHMPTLKKTMTTSRYPFACRQKSPTFRRRHPTSAYLFLDGTMHRHGSCRYIAYCLEAVTHSDILDI